MRRVTAAAIDHTTTGSRRHPRRRRGGTPILVVVALVAATLAAVVTAPTAPVAADGNEAPDAPLAARSITAGWTHSCALLNDGTAKCWGRGDRGQLGQDSTDTLGDAAGEMAALPAVNLGAGRTATAITAGGATASSATNTQFHTCALLDDGTVKCWGSGNNGQLGQGSTASLGDSAGEMAALAPVNLGAGRTAVAVSAGSHHTCALLDNATVKCWGRGLFGRLGQDSSANLTAPPADPINLGAGRTATAITAGGGSITATNTGHACALLDDGNVKCWGGNYAGQLGQDSTTNLGDNPGEMAALQPVNLGAGRTATAVTAGEGHTCALLDNGTVKCWGRGFYGQLGQGSDANLGDGDGEMAALVPVNLGVGRTATAVTAGEGHTCALLDNGTVKCWGRGEFGQLGQGSTANLFAPPASAVNLGAGRTATAVTAGAHHTCAVLDDATIRCWGSGQGGQLGQGSTATLGDQPGEMPVPAIVVGGPVGVPPGSLTLTKSADETTVVAGDTVHLHVTVANTGAVALNDVTVDDLNGPDCEAAPFDLAVGADLTVDCTYVTGAGDVGTYSNTASVTSDEVTTPVVSNQVDVTVTAPPAPSLTVTKTADETAVVVGDTIHLHVEVANTGNVALNDVTIDDPDGPDCEVAPFDLAVGADRTVDCTHTATPGELAGGYHNTASVTSDEVATAVESNTVDVTVTIPAGFGLVAGTVTETGSGDPIAGAVVAVLSTATYAPVAVATADAVGGYVAAPPAGTYYVYVLDPAQSHTAGFHGAPTAVVVTDGAAVTADAALASIRGTLAGTVTDTGGPVAGVLAMSIDLANGGPGAGDLTDTNGTYTIPGLTPGPRLLELVDLTGGHTVEFHDNSPTPAGASILNIVGAATTTADADLATATPPGAGAHLTGTITTTTGGANLEGIAVLAVHASDFSFATGALTDTNGDYDIALDPGDHKLAFYDPTGAHRFEWHDNQPASGLGSAATVTAVNGTPTTTDAALTPTTGTVTGVVTQTGTGTPLADVFVVAINTNGAVVGGATTAPDGTYTLTNLPPGDIRIRYVDLTATHTDQYHDNAPDYPGATLLPITPGSTTTNINATLTPTD